MSQSMKWYLRKSMIVAIQRIVTTKRKEEMQNSSDGGHQEKIIPGDDNLKKL